ncbi:hypothetical protein TNCV_415621 [Trichonephila clavipes]|nr:hypothetical protein TNCV_415621 [Trichonephila clavipes]
MPKCAIKDLLKKWDTVRAMVLEWHPNQADVSRMMWEQRGAALFISFSSSESASIASFELSTNSKMSLSAIIGAVLTSHPLLQ